MYIFKLANAAGSKITVTSTATSLYDLLDTAASTTNDLAGDLNAVDLVVEDGDVRMLMDGNTPTAANGILLSSGVVYSFRGVPLTKMKLIRTVADVAISVQIGRSEKGEGSSAAAYAVTLEAGSVTIGDVGVNDIGGMDVPTDDANMPASPKFFSIGGEYRATETTYTDGDATVLQTDINGYVKGVDKAYDSSTQSNKSAEVNPLNQAYVGETLAAITNGADGTYYYYVDMSGSKNLGLQMILSGGSGTCTVTAEGTLQDDGTAAAGCVYTDVTAGLFGVASTTASDIWLADTDIAFKYIRLKVVAATGAADDADWTLYSKKLY